MMTTMLLSSEKRRLVLGAHPVPTLELNAGGLEVLAGRRRHRLVDVRSLTATVCLPTDPIPNPWGRSRWREVIRESRLLTPA